MLLWPVRARTHSPAAPHVASARFSGAHQAVFKWPTYQLVIRSRALEEHPPKWRHSWSTLSKQLKEKQTKRPDVDLAVVVFASKEHLRGHKDRGAILHGEKNRFRCGYRGTVISRDKQTSLPSSSHPLCCYVFLLYISMHTLVSAVTVSHNTVHRAVL